MSCGICKEKVGLLGQECRYCMIKFCTKHRYEYIIERLPETHSNQCSQAAKLDAQKGYKQETARMKSLQEKRGVSAVSKKDVEKEQQDAKQRLRNAIAQKQQGRAKNGKK